MKGTESSSPEFPWLNFHEAEEVNTRILQRICGSKHCEFSEISKTR